MDELKNYSKNKDLKVVAFKLTSHASEADRKAAVDKLFKNSHADFVVHNDLSEIDVVKRTHRFTLHSAKDARVCEGLEQLTSELIQVILPKDIL